MRRAFIKALESAAESNDKIIFMTGDLGYEIFDNFHDRFKDRYINVGVAEAQMVLLASGLAKTGWRPIIYSIAPFVTVRPLEQILNDICYEELPVVIVGVGGGYAYGPNGPTHHAVCDLALMRVMPGMTVLAPADPWEVECAFKQALSLEKPVYLRLNRTGEPKIHGIDNVFSLGHFRRLREGHDVCLLVTGALASVALESAEDLSQRGLSVAVEQVHTLKPLDIEGLNRASSQMQLIVTLEEHSIGGLGSAVAEWCASKPGAPLLLSIHGQNIFPHECGSQNYFRKKYGLDAKSVVEAIYRHLKNVELNSQ